MSAGIGAKPKRGRTHPIFGVYVGGDSLRSKYKLLSPNSYSGTSQIRSKRSLNIAETSLHALQVNTMFLKFNGNLDVTEHRKFGLNGSHLYNSSLIFPH